MRYRARVSSVGPPLLARARGLALPGALALAAMALGRVPAAAVAASLEPGPRDASPRLVARGGVRVLEDPLLGARTPLAGRPCRIVSLTLASDLLLAALVETGRVVAVTPTVDDPTYSRATDHYPATVPRIDASAERILALTPDLVIVSSYSSAPTARALVGAGVPVLRLPAGRTPAEIAEATRLLADTVGEPEGGEALVRAAQATEAALRARPALTPAPRALWLAAGGYTHGRGTLTDALFGLAGARNVAAEEGLDGFVHIGAEVAVAWRPDVLVVPAEDEAAARASLALLAPALADALAATRIVALPSRVSEVTTPDAIEAARMLRDALERAPSGGPR